MSFILLGILNAQAEAAAIESDYDLLETEILASDTSSVSFTGLGSYSDYKHLQLRAVVRTDRGNSDVIELNFNSDTGSNYAYHYLAGVDGSMTSAADTSANFLRIFRIPGSTNSANVFGAVVTDILDFSSTSKNTTTRALAGFPDTSENRIYLNSGLYNSTDAITSFAMTCIGTNFVTGSRFSLYGLKETV